MGVNRLAVQATNHCLTGCGIGEVLGLVLATWWGWGDAASIALAVVLAFFFGYLLTLVPLFRAGLALGAAHRHRSGGRHPVDRDDGDRRQRDHPALAGRDGRGSRRSPLLGPLAIALAVAWGPTFLVNRALIRRGTALAAGALNRSSTSRARCRP